LWTVELHYHSWAYILACAAATADDESAQATQLFHDYLSDWMERCSLGIAGARELAWNAYAIATRLGWWIRCYRLLGAARLGESPGFAAEFLRSFWQQAAYLHDHLEWDLRGNHLLRDAVGLALAGRFFDEPQASSWLRTATGLAVEQAKEQVLPDGGHFERSPMYHVDVMEDLLSLSALLQDPGARAQIREAWKCMAEWLAWMRHPDGQIPLLNDAALNGAWSPQRMLEMAGSLGVALDAAPRRGGRHFAETGIAVWHSDLWTIFADVGPVGPDYQPGHAHADTLALECSWHSRRLFVDPGTHSYDKDDRRRYDRSTRAHNTVCVDGQDSSEVWHIFRVGRRAYPRNVNVEFSGGMNLVASHNGYYHLPGHPQHVRRVSVGNGGHLVVTDRVDGKGRHRVEGGWLLAPDWTVASVGGGWAVSDGRNTLRVTTTGPADLRLFEEERPYHPEFGREVMANRLCWTIEAELPLEITTVVEGA
jgi:uncharacterized heparinase superfamily protein